MPTRYLVLRTNVNVNDSSVLSSPMAWDGLKQGPTDLAIQTMDGHETDAGDLRADPRNVAVMDAEVALGLIAPKTQAPANVGSLKLVGALRMPDGLVAVGAHTTPFTGQGVTVA